MDKFTEHRIANKQHDCTRCSRGIGQGDEYLRRATPPWLSGWPLWVVIKFCSDCQENP